MTYQDKYNLLIERLNRTENNEKRPRAIWTDEQRELYDMRDSLRNLLVVIDSTTGNCKEIAEQSFEQTYKKIWAMLDKQNWV